MAKGCSVEVEKFFRDNADALQLSWISGKKGGDREIREGTVTRCGYALAGHYGFQTKTRIHVFGMAEMSFLRSLPPEDQTKNVRGYFEAGMPCLIFARNITPDPIFITCSNELGVPVFISPLVTTTIASDITFYLDRELAPSLLLHGSFVSIDGSGVFIRGKSGIGKSETTLELIRRGCAFIGDDAINVRRVFGGILEGTVANAQMRGTIEVRELGIINLIQLYGLGCYRLKRNIDLVVTLKPWEELNAGRGGLEGDSFRIIGVDVPHVTIGVAPGRDIASLVELSAREFRMRRLGTHAGKELNDKLIQALVQHQEP